MSLKAKLEAVIYAAEEPVTLAQLATIFAEEVTQGLEEAPAHEAEPGSEQIALEGIGPEDEAVPETEPVAEAGSVAEAEPVAEVGEGDEKKAARLRDRRVRQQLQGVLDELIADYS